MRNLKKVMALALATVMLLGIMVMGAGAADYTAYKDAASVDTKYELAIEMMKELGVFEGDNNGNLNAKNTLTRAEAAKVIAVVKLGKTTASKIGAPIAAPFADVAVDNWAAPYIAYAKDLGIISGVGDNKYDPAGTLTGYAFAKMLMVAAGYNAGKEGFTGATWDTNVNLKAYTLGLLEGLSINLADAITREQAIQMAFNTMTKVNMVSYKDSGFNITTPDGFQMSSNAGEYTYSTTTLMQYLYGAKTYEDGKNTDDYGFSQKAWFKGETVVAATANYTVVKAYDEKIEAVTEGDLFTAAGLKDTESGKEINVYVNNLGNKVGTCNLTKGEKKNMPAADYAGATMKLIKNDGTFVLVIEKPVLANVETFTAAKDGKKAFATLDIKNKDDKAYTIETEEYAKGDQVLVTLNAANTKIMAHKKATIVTGNVTEVIKDKDGKNVVGVVVDGVTYALAGTKVATAKVASTFKADFKPAKDGKFNLTVVNGYVIDVPAATVTGTNVKASLEKVVYLKAYTTVATNDWGVKTQYAQVINMVDGTTSLVKIEVKTDENGTILAPVWALNKLYTVEDVKDQTYKTLKAFDGISVEWKDGVKVEKQTIFFDATLSDTKIEKTAKFVNTTKGKAYLTEKTAILNVTGSAGDLAATYVAAPFNYDLAKNTDLTVIYTKNADGVLEAEVIIVGGKLADVAAKPTYATYYLFATEKGYVLDGDKVYTKMEAIDLKTFEKIDVTVKSFETTGFVKASVANGVYTFVKDAKAFETLKEVAADATKVFYKNMLTVGTDYVDYDVTNTVILNLGKVKTADGKAEIKTVAELAKVATKFYMDVDTKNAVVNYIVIE